MPAISEHLESRVFRRTGWRHKAEETFYRRRDPGWVFSRKLVLRVARRCGETPERISQIVDILGEEFITALLKGECVGLPMCPPTFVKRFKTNGKPKMPDGTDTYISPRLKLSKPLRRAFTHDGVYTRGYKDQLDAEKLRLMGTKKPPKVGGVASRKHV